MAAAVVAKEHFVLVFVPFLVSSHTFSADFAEVAVAVD